VSRVLTLYSAKYKKEQFIMTGTRSRRMQVTCNNPLEKGLTPEKIKEIMQNWITEYYCFCLSYPKDRGVKGAKVG